MLWRWSHRDPAVLPASGADALPRTTDFMHFGFCPESTRGALTLDERGRAFGGPAADRLLAPRSAQEMVQVPRCQRLTCFEEHLPGEQERPLDLRSERAML